MSFDFNLSMKLSTTQKEYSKYAVFRTEEAGSIPVSCLSRKTSIYAVFGIFFCSVDKNMDTLRTRFNTEKL